MGYVGNIVVKPVSIYDVQRALGTSENDLGTLCTRTSINMWAKYKPINYNAIGVITDANRATKNYGIKDIPDWSRITYMLSFLFGTPSSSNAPNCGIKPAYWAWDFPQGGASSPYRLTDFVNPNSATQGYFQGAEPPIGAISSDTYNYGSDGKIRIIYANGAQSANTIKLSELSYLIQFSWSTMYFGVALCRIDVTPNVNYIATQFNGDGDINMQTALEQGLWVDIAQADLPTGIYKCYPIVSEYPFRFATGSAIAQNDRMAVCLCDLYEGMNVISVGVTMVKMYIAQDTFIAYYDLDASTRVLYGGITLQNPNYQGTLNARVDIEVFNASNTSLGTATITTSTSGGGVAYGGSKNYTWQMDLSNKLTLMSAYSARAIVTPVDVSNPQTSSAQCLVTNGRPR